MLAAALTHFSCQFPTSFSSPMAHKHQTQSFNHNFGSMTFMGDIPKNIVFALHHLTGR